MSRLTNLKLEVMPNVPVQPGSGFVRTLAAYFTDTSKHTVLIDEPAGPTQVSMALRALATLIERNSNE